jgi:hypothetical protein
VHADEDERLYALRLVRGMSHEQVARWEQGSAADWANESHEVAVRFIYGSWAVHDGVLPSGYEAAALPFVNEQLEKAGFRLAEMLNAILK